LLLQAHVAGDLVLRLRVRELATLDPQNRWKTEPGVFEVWLGTSSRGGLGGTVEVVPQARAAARNGVSP
jgi:hypothetical protein